MARIVRTRGAGVKMLASSKANTVSAVIKPARRTFAKVANKRSATVRVVGTRGLNAKTKGQTVSSAGKVARGVVNAGIKRSAIRSVKLQKAPRTKVATKVEVQAELTRRISQHERSKKTAKRYRDELREAKRTIALLRNELAEAETDNRELNQEMSVEAASHAQTVTNLRERIRIATEAKLKAQAGAVDHAAVVAERNARAEEHEQIEKLKDAVIRWRDRATKLEAELNTLKRNTGG